MKYTIATLSLLVMLSTASATETLWVYGVNEHGGWYDANKTDYAADTNKCWAAVSSNLINWWQNQYVVNPNIPDEGKVWDTYRRSATNNMGDIAIGVDWWWTGNAYEIYGYFYPEAPLFGEGYTASYYNSNTPASYEYGDYLTIKNATDSDFASYLYNTLSAGRAGLGLNLGGVSGHGITLWGAEFSDTRSLTALYVTDSDDAVAAGVGDLGLFRVEVVQQAGGYYLEDYWGGTLGINSVTVLDAAATDAWGMPRIEPVAPAPLSVPEPTAAALALLTLAGFGMRRKRA